MSEIQPTSQPAILFSHFDGSGDFIAMAEKLLQQGYPVIAAHQRGDSVASEAAISIGCRYVEASGDGGLRVGLEFFNDHMQGLPGVVVFEPEDGFSVDDVLRVAEAFQANQGKLVMASRCRNPRLGLFTNLVRSLAALAFTLVHGRKVGDPWASLRAVPTRFVSGFLALKGDGCKLQMNMLLTLHHMGIKTISVPVSADYDYESDSRLLDRAIDILKILLLPLKYISASVITMLVDNSILILVGYVLTQNQRTLTIVLARYSGAIVGYIINRNVVFKQRSVNWKQEMKPLLKFALLATINTSIALLLIPYIETSLNTYFFIAKQMCDVILFISNYLIQREFIFRKKPHTGK